MKAKHLFGLCLSAAALGGWPCMPAQAASTAGAENPADSVFLFSYATVPDEGRSGLKMAWSRDTENWFDIGRGFAFVKSDYGEWGKEKRMVLPQLMRDAAGVWHAVWQLNGSGKELATAASADLTHWKRQTYFTDAEKASCVPAGWQRYAEAEAVINGEKQRGTLQKVAWSDVNRLILFAGDKAWRTILDNERAEDDGTRFAGLNPVAMKTTLTPGKEKAISDKLIGVFFEDINYGADGGIYAELIQNRDFEYLSTDHDGWNATTAWSLTGNGMELSVATDRPIHENNAHYAVLAVKQPGASLENGGFDGIVLKGNEKYDLSLFARSADKKAVKLRISLVNKAGEELCSKAINVSSADWKKQTIALVPQGDATEARLRITPQNEGVVHLDMISLFPRNTFHGRKNGLRQDLAQTIADIHPKFVRFPGGCAAHGNGVDNIYHWKNTIGALESRKPARNIWGYHQTMGLGYFEYFQFCEDMGAEPLPVLAAGVPCQNSACIPGRLLSGGQQGGIPMEEMDEYVQEVLDLIEYANGDAKDKNNKWARMRAEAGHPKPFNLKYIGIGNEDLITDVFEERFTMIYNAVKAKYPEITVIGTVGPFYEGTDYEEGWALAEKLELPMVDEHYYNTPGWFINNQDFYDRYPRTRKTTVYLGEYASHLPGRPNNIETALSEALYLTAVERNGDVVEMTSYAPLLAKENHTQWNPDLIYFNNTEVKPTTGYQVQKLFGRHSGDTYYPAVVTLDNPRTDVRNRVGQSVVKDSKSGDIIVKLVNLLPVAVTNDIDLSGIAGGTRQADLTVLKGKPADRDVKPEESVIEVSDTFRYELPAYSFSVIRIPGNVEKQ